MKRQDAIEQLSAIQYHIEDYQNRLLKSREDNIHLTDYEYSHRKYINSKSLAYWKRRYNRISFKLMYNL